VQKNTTDKNVVNSTVAFYDMFGPIWLAIIR